MARSSLLRRLVGMRPSLAFLLPPVSRGGIGCPCLASRAATRLRKHNIKGVMISTDKQHIANSRLSKPPVLTFCSFQEGTILRHYFGFLHCQNSIQRASKTSGSNIMLLNRYNVLVEKQNYIITPPCEIPMTLLADLLLGVATARHHCVESQATRAK